MGACKERERGHNSTLEAPCDTARCSLLPSFLDIKDALLLSVQGKATCSALALELTPAPRYTIEN